MKLHFIHVCHETAIFRKGRGIHIEYWRSNDILGLTFFNDKHYIWECT